jgi:hypothetical protein
VGAPTGQSTYEPYAYVELEQRIPVLDALDGQKFGQNHIRVHERVFVPTRAARAG